METNNWIILGDNEIEISIDYTDDVYKEEVKEEVIEEIEEVEIYQTILLDKEEHVPENYKMSRIKKDVAKISICTAFVLTSHFLYNLI